MPSRAERRSSRISSGRSRSSSGSSYLSSAGSSSRGSSHDSSRSQSARSLSSRSSASSSASIRARARVVSSRNRARNSYSEAEAKARRELRRGKHRREEKRRRAAARAESQERKQKRFEKRQKRAIGTIRDGLDDPELLRDAAMGYVQALAAEQGLISFGGFNRVARDADPVPHPGGVPLVIVDDDDDDDDKRISKGKSSNWVARRNAETARGQLHQDRIDARQRGHRGAPGMRGSEAMDVYVARPHYGTTATHSAPVADETVSRYRGAVGTPEERKDKFFSGLCAWLLGLFFAFVIIAVCVYLSLGSGKSGQQKKNGVAQAPGRR